MFTDIGAAIEEARWLRIKKGHDYAVVQAESGVMKVHLLKWLGVTSKIRVMFSTKEDGNGTVLPEVR
ncbi:MAG: hypothetical protein E7K97_19745 [Providencia rettgeri]|nr:hypothetical protein [Providencia rettgeri]